MLHLHRAERPEHLVAALGCVLEAAPPDPLTTELVAVHSRGIERWIAQELASVLGTGAQRTDGVCANVAFPFPGGLVRSAVAAGSGIDPDEDPWLAQRLVWPLLELLEEHTDDPALGPLTPFAGGTRGPEEAEGRGRDARARRFGTVRHIADLFDQYGVHRPEMLGSWAAGEYVGPEGGPLADRFHWQAHLWRAVRRRVGLPSFAERHRRACERVAADPDLLDLPPRLSLFGLTSLPASYLAVLTAIAEHRDVHLMLLHPSGVLWSRVEEATAGMLGLLWPRDDDPTARLPRNPLLASWGRDARELQLVAPAPDEVTDGPSAGDDEPASTTLLGQLQRDVRADRPPGGRDEPPVLAPDDRSVQVHDCHGRLRQVEVVRDTLLHLLAEDPDLELRDIIVMCPDIEAFAPLVTAVFGAEAVVRDSTSGTRERSDGTPPQLRVRLADRSLRRTNPVLEVVSQLLELVSGRVTASAVLDLISREPVRHRFALTDEDVELIEIWIADLGIRWGLDGAHRARHGLPDLDAYTWQAGLERLQLGMAMADEDLRLVDGVTPFDGVEGRTSDLAGRLVELLARLERSLDGLRGPQTILGWREAIGAGADSLTATDADSGWQRQQLHRVLDGLVDEATTTDGEASAVELSLPEARSLLSDRLAGRPSTTSHRTGDLTVCTLVPMRSVPHRVICLLGLDDGTFPRRSVPDADDLLLQAPRVGDRDLRSEDRQLLLDALLAAGRTLVVTYAGRDVRTNEQRPPAVPVDELLDTIDRTVRTTDGRRPREHVIVRHPLASHDPRNFEPGGLGPDHDRRAWSFDPAGLLAAEALRAAPRPASPFLTAALEPPAEDVIDLDDLIGLLQHPARAFARQRLEVSFTGDDEEVSDSIPASLRGRDAWQVGDAVVRTWTTGGDPDRCIDVLRGRGSIPPGDLAAADLRTVRERAGRIIDLCGRLGLEPVPRRTVHIDVELPDGRTLVGTIPDVAGWRIESVGYAKIAPHHRLASWVRLLAASIHQPEHPWSAVTAGRHPWRDRAQAIVLEPFEGTPEQVRDRAHRRLGPLIDLFDRGRCAPLPLYAATSAKIAENLRRDEDPRAFVDKEWETGPYDAYDREDRDPYHLLVLGRPVPTDELFEDRVRDDEEACWGPDGRRVVAYAWRLWEPILGAERRCEA